MQQLVFGDLRQCRHAGDLFRRHGAVQRVGNRHGPDQDQHDQAHAFLPVVGAMGKGNPGTGEDQQTADPQRRRRIILGGGVQLTIFDEDFQRQQQQGSKHKTDHRGKQQGIAHLNRLAPVNTAGAGTAMD
ncbi:hypothetical protein D3C73_1027720 [compost metagenome]